MCEPCLSSSANNYWKVIGEYEFTPIPGVRFQNLYKAEIGTCDRNGDFKIEIPDGIDTLRLVFIGMEGTSIIVPTECENLEIIMMVDVIYDFTPVRKINKDRLKRFKNLLKMHHHMREKGIFTSDRPCFKYLFEKY